MVVAERCDNTIRTKPFTTLQFVGIELDYVSEEAELSLDKLTKCRTLVNHFHKKRSVTPRKCSFFIGLLNFCCSVVTPGRAFFAPLN